MTNLQIHNDCDYTGDGCTNEVHTLLVQTWGSSGYY